jgi:hypothetical protein
MDKKNEENKIELVTEDESLLSTPTEKKNKTIEEAFAPYIIFLNAMKVTKKALTSAPTFEPKTFYQQIQLYDSGGVRRLYIYINGAWRYVVIT